MLRSTLWNEDGFLLLFGSAEGRGLENGINLPAGIPYPPEQRGGHHFVVFLAHWDVGSHPRCSSRHHLGVLGARGGSYKALVHYLHNAHASIDLSRFIQKCFSGWD